MNLYRQETLNAWLVPVQRVARAHLIKSRTKPRLVISVDVIDAFVVDEDWRWQWLLYPKSLGGRPSAELSHTL